MVSNAVMACIVTDEQLISINRLAAIEETFNQHRGCIMLRNLEYWPRPEG